jgi:hypothetical protein
MTYARDHREPFSFIDQHFIPSDTAISPFPDSGGDAFGSGSRSVLIVDER